MTPDNRYKNYKSALNGTPFPHAILDMDLLDQNIRANVKRAGKKTLRIASKSVRSPEILRYLLAADSRIQGIMAFHGREAVFLADTGFDDILLGYPVVEETLIEAIGKLLKKGKKICLMVDHAAHLDLLEKVGRKIGIVFPVCVDIDLSLNLKFLHFGVWRSPITSRDQLYTFIQKLKNCEQVRVEGLMGYEAQIAGLGDKVPGYGFKNQVIRYLKSRALKKIGWWRKEAVDLLKNQFPTLRLVNGGGSGSMESTREENVVTEITVGSGFYAPHLFDNYRNFRLQPALMYAVQVVRIPRPGVYTCHGGGYIASGGIEGAKAPRVQLPVGARLDIHEGAGEVQTPVFYAGPEPLNIGDPVFLRHAKAGELCEHFNELTLIRDGKITGTAATYRGLGLNFC